MGCTASKDGEHCVCQSEEVGCCWCDMKIEPSNERTSGEAAIEWLGGDYYIGDWESGEILSYIKSLQSQFQQSEVRNGIIIASAERRKGKIDALEKDRDELVNYVLFSTCGGRDCIGAGEVLSATQHQCSQCAAKTHIISKHVDPLNPSLMD